MDKYKFVNENITDAGLMQTLIVSIMHNYLGLSGYKLDDMERIAWKIKKQWGYVFEFKYENFKKQSVIENYHLIPETDVYVKLNSPKNITFVFDKKTKLNLQRFLFLKAWAYDVFDAWKPGDELYLNVMTCKDKFERNWAERFAIELTLSDVDYQRIKDGSKAGDILAIKKIMEPELYAIREHEYEEERWIDRKWMKPDF
ncbi:hypothetical protein EI71_00683 [Anaeroplasma bactoclasticum]|jgi:hypothetical protein|uniref:Uncharacterized protein n=1 Tax=Anaeroplasma bactoclasticum TaxID=2088 RepID=A0A397RU92_9MOLU|nr:hypothetical protein [Anaeroplasma bactoclasticum]RIA77900.1 hypothetical protein EI71_00683 [Anaeroplasma bactoclasticum]